MRRSFTFEDLTFVRVNSRGPGVASWQIVVQSK